MMRGSGLLHWGCVLFVAAVLACAGLAIAQDAGEVDVQAESAAETAVGMEGIADDAQVPGTPGEMESEAPAPVAPARPAFDEPDPAAQEAHQSSSGFVDYFQKGGRFMWPLLLASIVGLAAIIERAITLRRASTDTRKFIGHIVQDLRANGIASAIQTCQSTRGPIAAIIHSGLTKADQGPEAVEKAIEAAGGIEVSFLQRGLIVIASVANVAPLLGFLGTVSGMIGAFEAIAAADQVSAKLVASGISEALITTQSGLAIAIPMQVAYNYYVSRIDRFIVEMEESSMDLINELENGAIKK